MRKSLQDVRLAQTTSTKNRLDGGRRAFWSATLRAYTPRRNPGGAVARQSGSGDHDKSFGDQKFLHCQKLLIGFGCQAESREGVLEPYASGFRDQSRIVVPVGTCRADASVDGLESDRNNGPLVSSAQQERRKDR